MLTRRRFFRAIAEATLVVGLHIYSGPATLLRRPRLEVVVWGILRRAVDALGNSPIFMPRLVNQRYLEEARKGPPVIYPLAPVRGDL